MKYRLEYHPEVKKDLLEAREYYNEQKTDLGEELIGEIFGVIEYVKQDPLHFQKVYKNTRKANVKRFPLWYILFLLSFT